MSTRLILLAADRLDHVPHAPHPLSAWCRRGQTRHGFALGGIWEDTHVLAPPESPASLTNVMTGRRFSCGDCYLKDVLRVFPVALLVRDAGGDPF